MKIRYLRQALVAGLLAALPAAHANAQLQSPGDVFGFQPGDDYKLARWETIVEYFEKLAAASEIVRERSARRKIFSSQ